MKRKTQYPKKIKEIMLEASLAYSIVVVMDYKSGKVSANNLYKQWQIDKLKNVEKINL